LRGARRAGGADAVEEDGGGLVVGILGDESAFEGFVENGLAEAGGAGLSKVTHGAKCANGIEVHFEPLHLSNLLLGGPWHRYRR
jgi:hypothetical protein